MIRAYEEKDLDAVIAIANRAWAPINAAYRALYGEELFQRIFPNAETRAGVNLQRDMEAHPGQTIVCASSGRVIAFCNYWMEEDKKVGVVGYNAVDPECGLKGIGQEMYAWVLSEFRRKGMLYARVLTGLDEGHARARRAYERAGFNISHGSVTYYKKL